jgi:glycosyltransferase involved in cell wall biosynthesis
MKCQKKVCIAGPSKRFTSGISYYTIKLANAMSDPYQVSVVCFRQLLPTFLFPGKDHVGKNISALDFNSRVNVFDGMDYNNPFTWIKAYRFLRRQKPDIVILQWWTSSVAHMHILLKLFAGLTCRPKIIIEFHEVVDPFEDSILPIRAYSRFMGKLLRKDLSAYITHSESDKELIAQRYNIDPGSIYVIPHGLYDQYGTPFESNTAKEQLSINEEFVVLSFGLIRKYKGIPDLIKAFEQLPGEIVHNSRLLIVGEIWDDRKDIMNQIAASPCKDKITLIDEYIPDDRVSLYFSAADVVVLPYLRASQSGIAHIAMVFGKPVVVSHVGGLQESMADYRGTFFVGPGNIQEIAAAIAGQFGSDEKYEPPQRTWEATLNYYSEVMAKLFD